MARSELTPCVIPTDIPPHVASLCKDFDHGFRRRLLEHKDNLEFLLHCEEQNNIVDALDRFYVDRVSGSFKDWIMSLPDINLIEPMKNEFEESMRQSRLDDGGVATLLDDVYDAAHAALPLFEDFLRREFGSICEVIVAPLKGRERAMEKINDDYSGREPGPACAWLFDVVRGTLICHSEAQMEDCVKRLLEVARSEEYVFARLKNKFRFPVNGYRDFNVNLRVSLGRTPSGRPIYHMCELQIQLADLVKIKAMSHEAYEYFRKFFRGSAESVNRRIDLVQRVAATCIQVSGTTLAGAGSAAALKAASPSALASGLVSASASSIGGGLFGSLSVESFLAMDLKTDLLTCEALGALRELLKLMCVFPLCESIERIILAIQEVGLDPAHPVVISTLKRIAEICKQQGHDSDARTLYQEVWSRTKDSTACGGVSLGRLHDLCGSLCDLGEFDAARNLYMPQLPLYDLFFSRLDIEALSSIGDVRKMLLRLKNTQLAQTYSDRIISAGDEELASTASISGQLDAANYGKCHALGCMLSEMGQYRRSKAMFVKALLGREASNDAATLRTIRGLGDALTNLEEFSDAAEMMKRVLDGTEKLYGPCHIDTMYADLGPTHAATLASVNNLAGTLDQLGE